MHPHVIRAIFRRNFISYFSNPTGYVFICVFVLLSSIAAFWPNDFFNANLANLDQLNKYLPYILLVFIPAITMSIWSEERRQGTDELLLTIPAGDFDVVLGKYLAAVAIFTASLLFSMFCNAIVLGTLGNFDIGLFVTNYFGYWTVGLAMLAIGMVASFLTGNLTVGFVLGAMFNAPLVFANWADVIVKDAAWSTRLRGWSIAEQFQDFSRGVVSLASVAYFWGLTALMLYLAMVLIGRRHWRGGHDGRNVAMHYLVRFIALLAIVLGVNIFLNRHDTLRADLTFERLSSLSPQTRELLANMNPKYPIKVESYISNNIPEGYIETALNLRSTLRELEQASGGKIQHTLHELDPLSEEATRAELQYGIRPQQVESRSRGARTQEDIYLSAAITCGLEKVVIPFFAKGLPVEYELVRSISTVGQGTKRKKVGVLTTDAKLYGGFDMQSMASSRNEMVIDELQKQYEVVQVDPTNPITERYDVLLAVQPSSLSPPQMENFVAAVTHGQPTAIFEDPFPFLAGDVPGTKAPKQQAGGMNPFMQRQPPQPKGDINQLWRTLGVDFKGSDVIWQDYNPYPKARSFLQKEWVFVDDTALPDSFNQKELISSKLQQLLFPFPGSLVGLHSSPLTFTPLIITGNVTGTVPYDEIIERSMFGTRLNPNLAVAERPTNEKYVLAAHITGKLKTQNMEMSDKEADDEAAPPATDGATATDGAAAGSEVPPGGDAEPAEETPATPAVVDAPPKRADSSASKKGTPEKPEAEKPPVDSDINVVLVGDIDCLYSAFFMLRARGAEDGDEVDWHFDNVTFVLNVLDVLANDTRFVEIRKRHPVHRTLNKVLDRTQAAREEADKKQQDFKTRFDKAQAQAQKEFDDRIAELRKRSEGNTQQLANEIAIAKQNGEQRLATQKEKLKQTRDRELKGIERDLAQAISHVQDRYKLAAMLLPPIPPLLVACFVYFNRRNREREGVSKARLR